MATALLSLHCGNCVVAAMVKRSLIVSPTERWRGVGNKQLVAKALPSTQQNKLERATKQINTGNQYLFRFQVWKHVTLFRRRWLTILTSSTSQLDTFVDPQKIRFPINGFIVIDAAESPLWKRKARLLCDNWWVMITDDDPPSIITINVNN